MAISDVEHLRHSFELLKQGDEAALGSIWEAEGRWLTGVIYRNNGGHFQEALEGANEVLERAWNNRETIDLQKFRNPNNWLGRVARNIGFDQARSHRSRPKLLKLKPGQDGKDTEIEDLLIDADSDPANEVELSERNQLIWDSLQTLPEAQRQAIALVYFGNMSNTEAAAYLGNPLPTTKTRIRLGVRKLRDRLGDQADELNPPAIDRPLPAQKKEEDPLSSAKRAATSELNHYLGLGPEEIAQLIGEQYRVVGRWLEVNTLDEKLTKRDAKEHQDLATRRRRALARMVINLPTDQAALVTLRFITGHSTSESAQLLGLPLQEARTKISEGLAFMRRAAEDKAETSHKPALRKKIFQLPGREYRRTKVRVDLWQRFAQPGETFQDMISRVVKDQGNYVNAAAYLGIPHQTMDRILGNQESKKIINPKPEPRMVLTPSGKQVTESPQMAGLVEKFGQPGENIKDLLERVLKERGSVLGTAKALNIHHHRIQVFLDKLELA